MKLSGHTLHTLGRQVMCIERQISYWSAFLTALVLFLYGGVTNSMAEDSVGKEKWVADLSKVTLKTQDGKEVRFYEDLVKGKIVIINFMYTQCKGLCDGGTANLLQVQKGLGGKLGRDVFIYSITLDPEHDTPEVLKAYAKTHEAKPGWIFLTGSDEDVTTLRNKLGLSSFSPELRQKLGGPNKVSTPDATRKQHTGMILIGNEPFNKWERVRILSKPDFILQVIKGMEPPQAIPKALEAIVRKSSSLAITKAIATSTTVKTIKAATAAGDHGWQPNELSASVGETVEWSLGSGNHGVRITNWAAVKEHVEVEAVVGQQPFNVTTGRNDTPTTTAGRVLLRLKIKSVPPAPVEIAYNCIVHGVAMRGKVSIAAAVSPAASVPPEARSIEADQAAVKAVEASAGNVWQPNDISAAVGDVVEWKLGAGTHGVRITNWAAVKAHVEVETVGGQQPFNTTTGRNDSATSTAGQVLLRLKIRSVPPAPAEITYNCIVHGTSMRGKVSIAAAVSPAASAPEARSIEADQAAVRAVEASAGNVWQPNDISAAVGDAVEWKLGAGTHGVRITNWAAVKDHMEVETVAGQQPFNATTGRNDSATSTAGQVLLRLKIRSVPPAPAEITYNCIVHGTSMRGKVSLTAASGGN